MKTQNTIELKLNQVWLAQGRTYTITKLGPELEFLVQGPGVENPHISLQMSTTAFAWYILKMGAKKILYTPTDGDYKEADIIALSEFITDLLGDKFTHATEVQASVALEDPTKLDIRAYITDEYGDSTDLWNAFDGLFDVPEGWTIEEVNQIISDGTVYFQPVERV